MLFDLPAVAERARARFAAAGLARRAQRRRRRLPARRRCRTGADVVSLVRVVHDHDDAAALAHPARGAHARCRPAARCCSPSRWPARRGAEPIGDAYFGFYLLAMGTRPAAHAPASCARMLRAAGLRRACGSVPTRMPLQTGLLRARAALTIRCDV